MSDPVKHWEFHRQYRRCTALKPETLLLTDGHVFKLLCRDLDQASMEAVVSLLAGLPLQPEEGDGVELMEAKSQLFLK